MKEIKKIIAIIASVMLLMGMMIVPAWAAVVNVAETGVTKIEFEAYTDSYDAGPSNHILTISKSAGYSGDAYTAIHANADWAAYDLYVEKGGIYKLKVAAVHPYGTTATALECYDGTRLISKGLQAASSTNGTWATPAVETEYEQVVLKTGKITIKFVSKFAAFYDYFTLERVGDADGVGTVIPATGETKIEFESFDHGYDSAVTTGKLAASAASQYSGGKYVAIHSGTNPDFAEFDINVKETGIYNLKVAALHPSGITGVAAKFTEGSIVLTSGGISAPVDVSAGWNATPTVNDWGTFILTEGLTTVRFTGATSAHFDYFTLTKVENAEISNTVTVPASSKTDSWDKSANKTHSVSSSGYISLGTGDWVTFDVKVPYDGKYNVDVNAALPASWGGTSPIKITYAIDGGETTAAEVLRSADETWTPRCTTIASVDLKAGAHSITITGVQNEFWMFDMRISKVGDIVKPIVESKAIEAENYVDYVDNTPGIDDEENNVFFGDDVEIITTEAGYAVQVEAGESLYYSLNVEESGYYNVKFLMEDIASAQNVEINVSDETLTAQVVGTGENAYALITVGEIYLESGEHDVEIVNISEEGIFNLDCIKFYKENISFTANNQPIADVVAGGMDANIDMNGFLAGKDALCVFAVYDGGKLVGVDAKVVEDVTDNTDVTLSVKLDSVTSTYSAKAFVWDAAKQIGSYEILGE